MLFNMTDKLRFSGVVATFKFAKTGYFSKFIFFLPYFPIRRKVSKGTTKGKRDCDLPLSFGNLSPSNACFCYHSDQSAASQDKVVNITSFSYGKSFDIVEKGYS